MQVRERRGSTVAQLKADIDSGRTGDKIPVLDPAAAPLGTDDEASGTPPDPAAVTMARRQSAAPGPSGEPERSARFGAAWIVVAVAIAAAILIVAAALLLR
jgi:hypothetical protein